MSIPFERSDSKLIPLLGIALMATVLAIAIAYGVLARDEAGRDAAAEQAVVARVLAEQVTGSIDAVAATLSGVAAAIKNSPAETASQSRLLLEATASQSSIAAISLVDAEGAVLISSDSGAGGQRFNLKSTFGTLMLDESLQVGQLQVGPANAHRQSGTANSRAGYLPLLKSVRDASGGHRFLLAMLRPDETLMAFDSRRDGGYTAAILSANGELVASSRGAQGTRIAAIDARAITAANGSYEGPGITGEAAIGAFQHIARYPLTIAVDRPTTVAADRAWQRARGAVLASLLGAIAIAALSFISWRIVSHRERNQREHDRIVGRLRENELRKRAIQEAAPDAIVSFDVDHRIVEFNRSAERLFGWNRLDVLGKNLFERIVNDEMRPAFVEAMRRFQETGHSVHLGGRLELTLRRSDGLSLPAETVITRVDTASGLLFTMHIRDLRPQKEASAALRTSEQRHRVVLDTVREVIFQTDREGAFTYLNMAWRRITLLRIEETLGRRIEEFVLESDRPPLQRQLDALFTSGPDAPLEPIELRFATSEGGTRLLHLSLQAIRDADGNVTGAVGTLDDITEKRAVEIKLREQLRLSQELLEAIPLPVALKDPSGAFRAVNRAWEKFMGRQREDVLDKTIFDVVPEALAKRFSDAERDLLANGGTGVVDGILRRADGSIRNVLNYDTVFARDDGTASGTISALVDITEQKASEEEARRANRELKDQLHFTRNLLEAIPVPVTSMDAGGRCTAVNRAWEEFFGQSREAILGKTDESLFVRPEELSPLRDAETQIAQSGGSIALEADRTMPGGGIRHLRYYKTAVRNAAGDVEALISTVVDLTAEKTAETAARAARDAAESANRELQNQLKFSQEILDAMPLPVSFRNRDGVYEAVNRAWEEFYGMRRSSVLGQGIGAIAQKHDDTDNSDRRVLANGGKLTYDAKRRHADGSERDVVIYKAAYTDGNQRGLGVITASFDVTDRIAAEVEAKRARELAESANRAKNEFLASISHELRTPLTGIIGMAGLALETQLPPEPREYMDLVRSSADTLLYIIDDMHDFARIESGELAIERTTFNPRALVGEVLRMMAMRAHDKGLELVIDLESDVPAALQGDANRLRQILVNLTNNAIKHTEQGEVEVKVWVASREDRSITLHFAVRDTGPGIAPQRRERLLAAIGDSKDPTDVHKQSGALGLAITSRLIRLMGGSRLELDSVEGEGTTFSFTLPLAMHPAGMVDLPSGAMAGRLLIVDGNARARSGTAKVLARLGVNTSSAASGVHVEMWLASAMREGEPFDWAFVDAGIGTEESLAIARAIAERSPDTRIVLMLTVAGKGSSPAPYREAGFKNFVRKPLLEHDVARVLSNVDTTPEQRASAPAATDGAQSTKGSILVAEDNIVNQALVRRLLQSAGYEVTVVANGRAAVESVESGRFDLILMDVQMPEMGGIEATRRIREMEANGLTRTPIVALTAHAFGRDRELCLAAGMDGYLAKPVKVSALKAVLATHIGGEVDQTVDTEHD